MVNLHNSMRTRLQELFSPDNVPKPATKKEARNASTDDTSNDFASLLTDETAAPPPASTASTTTAPDIPTVESMFGSNPWMENPGGVGPTGSYSYNPMQFATRATAEKLAQMYGGTVVETDAMTPYGPFKQNQPNELIQFPNGTVLNAGLMVSYFNRGYTQDQVDQFVKADIG